MRRRDLEEQRSRFRIALTARMAALGLNGIELARLVPSATTRSGHVHPSTVTGWLQGAIPQGQVLADLAKALRMTPDQLVPGEATGPSPRAGQQTPDYVAGVLDTIREMDVAMRRLRNRVTGKRTRGTTESLQDVSDAIERAHRLGQDGERIRKARTR